MALPSRTRAQSVSDCGRAGSGSRRPVHRGRAGVAGVLVAAVLLAAAALLLAGQGSAAAGAPPGTPPDVPAGAPLGQPSTLNVMVFNIEVGGTLVSFAKVAEAIKDSGADVVGIEEAQGHIPRLARLLGWPYYSTRCQIVSQYPLIDPPGGRGVYLFVEPAPGEVVAMMNVHLPSDPYGPYWVRDGKSAAQVIALEKKVRLPAIQAQLAALPSLLAYKIPVFLTGDFNSPSFLDWTPAAVDTRTYDNGKKPWPPIALEWPVSKAVVDAGFRDSFRDIYPDPVADPGLTWWAKKPHVSVADENFGPLDVQDRIDYVYAAGPSVTTASRIVGEVGGPEVSVSVSPWPSDHRGVVSSFDITPATPPVFVAVGQRLVNIGENLKVMFHAPGGPNESVAIARTTASPSAPPLVKQPTGAGAPTDGTLTFATSRFAPGHYRVSLLDASGTVLSHTFFWTKAKATRARVYTAKRVYRVGQPIVVRWRNTPGERWDWVGVYSRGANPNVAYYWLWGYTFASIAGHRTLDRAQPYFGYGPQPWPLAPGRYSVYLLRDDGYAVIARGVFRVVKR